MANKKLTSTNALNRDFLEDRCTLNKVLRIIGKRWVAEVLVLIRNDARRFSQLKECLAGISDNVLSTVLNELLKEKLIEKQIFGEIPVRVEYKVTGKGRELTDLMAMLCKWGKTHIPFEVRMESLRKAAAPLKFHRRSQADFLRRPAEPDYGGQVAPSPPLATSAKRTQRQKVFHRRLRPEFSRTVSECNEG